MRVAFIVAIIACLAVSAVAQQTAGTATVKFYSDVACSNQIGASSYGYAYISSSTTGNSQGNFTATCNAITGTNTSFTGSKNASYVTGTSYIPVSSIAGISGGSWSFSIYPTSTCAGIPSASSSLIVSSVTGSTDLTQCQAVTSVSSGTTTAWWTRVYGNTAATTSISFAVAAVALLASLATFTF